MFNNLDFKNQYMVMIFSAIFIKKVVMDGMRSSLWIVPLA